MGDTDDSNDVVRNSYQGNRNINPGDSKDDDSSSSNSSVYSKERHRKRSSRRRDEVTDDKKKKRKKDDRKKKKRHRHRHKFTESDLSSGDEEEGDKSKSRHKKKHRSSREKKGHDDTSLKKNDTSIQKAQPAFGKYGIIRESDYRTSAKIRRSFEIWLEEIKGIPQGSNVAKNELINYFKDYAEDFNTATLPHEKFYDYDRWEADEYERKKNDVMKDGKSTAKSDEFYHREELLKKEQDKRRREMELIRSGMTREKVEEMKHQAQLKAEMVNAYKTGDEEKRKRLQKRLEPEEDALNKR